MDARTRRWAAGWRWMRRGCCSLSITSGLFLVVSFYVVGYLGQEANRHATDAEEGFLFDNAPEAVFIGCLLLFLSAMTLVTVSQHFGLIWVGDRSNHAGQRAAHLFSPAPSLARSDLEISAHLLGRHRSGVAGQFLSGRGGDAAGPVRDFRWCFRNS